MNFQALLDLFRIFYDHLDQFQLFTELNFWTYFATLPQCASRAVLAQGMSKRERSLKLGIELKKGPFASLALLGRRAREATRKLFRAIPKHPLDVRKTAERQDPGAKKQKTSQNEAKVDYIQNMNLYTRWKTAYFYITCFALFLPYSVAVKNQYSKCHFSTNLDKISLKTFELIL